MHSVRGYVTANSHMTTGNRIGKHENKSRNAGEHRTPEDTDIGRTLLRMYIMLDRYIKEQPTRWNILGVWMSSANVNKTVTPSWAMS